jgi:hypothetical protein
MRPFERWLLPFCVLAAACYGVFVLPFHFPPPPLDGISVANVAGFNNRVATIAAAVIGVVALGLSFKANRLPAERVAGDYGLLPRGLVLSVTALVAAGVGYFSYLIVGSSIRFGDAYYFLHQISMYVDFGRRLYDQIELPYGPLLFYGPVAVRSLLSPFHVSLVGAYFTTLVVEQVLGLLAVAYVLDSLPMLRRWKILFFLLCALTALLQPSFGLNYTFFRFGVPPACLVFVGRQRRLRSLVAALAVGQMVTLGISPEMGFAFFAGAGAYVLWFLSTGRYKWPAWAACLAALLAASAGFFLIAGRGFILMLGMFSAGIYNFIVEPLPYVLLFLLLFVWVVPQVIAQAFLRRRVEAPLLGALYVFSIALLPVAFGRADPEHVFLNGFSIYALAFLSFSYTSERRQTVWAVCTSAVIVWSALASLSFRPTRLPVQEVVRHRLFGPQPGLAGRTVAAVLRRTWPAVLERQYFGERLDNSASFDFARLERCTGGAPVYTPYPIGLSLEKELRQTGQFVPSFYDFDTAVLNRAAELRQVAEMNANEWALIPSGSPFNWSATASMASTPMGIRLPYKDARQGYVVGKLMQQDLATDWQPYAAIDEYVLYRRR